MSREGAGQPMTFDDDHDDTRLVLAARAGEDAAFAELVDRWLDRCYDVAWHVLHDRDLAADAAQDTLVTAWRRLPDLQKPESFGGWVLRIARNRALTILERERRSLPTGDDAMLEHHQGAQPDTAGTGIEAAERDALVWAAAAALGERDASVLHLHLRHGLGPAELADELEVTPNAAHQLLFRLRGRLGTAIRAWALWRGGHPRCEILAAELERRGAIRFSAETARLIDRHAAGCATCEDDRAAVVSPAALFASVPLLLTPPDLRTRLIASLHDAGVPAPDGPSTPAGPWRPRRPWRRGAVASLVAVAALLTALLGLEGDRPPATLVADTETALPTTVPPTTEASTTGPSPEPAPPAEPAPLPAPPPEDTAAPAPADLPAGAADPVEPTVAVDPVDTPPVEPVSPGATPGDAAPAPSPPPPGTDPAPTTTTTTTTTVPAPPVVHRFEVVPSAAGSGACASPRLTSYQASWATSGATTATLTEPVAGEEPVDTTGTTTRCAVPGSTFSLTADGPGGRTTQQAVAP